VSKVTVNKTTSLEIEFADQGITIDGNSFNWDIVKLSEGYFHILHNKKSYKAEIVKSDKATKTFTFKINNHIHTVEVKDKFDLLLEKLGMNNGTAGKVNNVKAPMPGLIIDVKIQAGDTVKINDALLILEAMKMENVLKSPGEGIVKSVTVKKGDKVEKNQVLIEFQ
jgi:biotin carboxyl carrier protein